MSCSQLAQVLKLMNHFISLILKLLGGHSKPWITESKDTESVDMGA
jgi:hypothetical protein